jgi:UDP:flavonoid glycosyltransferase YjiC (YdhE family)
LPDEKSLWGLEPALNEFLYQKPSPVYIGFGSMPVANPTELTALVIRALKLSGQRAVVQGIWFSAGSPSDRVLVIGKAPHGWLFSKCSAAIHHGGANTTARSLQAGLPTIIIPQAWDQFFWGNRVEKLGVGPSPIPYRNLTANKLARAIDLAVNSGLVRQRSRSLGDMLKQEQGADVATAVIDKYLKSR